MKCTQTVYSSVPTYLTICTRLNSTLVNQCSAKFLTDPHNLNHTDHNWLMQKHLNFFYRSTGRCQQLDLQHSVLKLLLLHTAKVRHWLPL